MKKMIMVEAFGWDRLTGNSAVQTSEGVVKLFEKGDPDIHEVEQFLGLQCANVRYTGNVRVNRSQLYDDLASFKAVMVG